MKQWQGFHLVEVLMALTIMGLLISVSVPIYSHYVAQARRLEAAKTLSVLAVHMEKYYLEQNTYAGASLKKLGIGEWVANHIYHLAILLANAEDYQLAAIPKGEQAKLDKACGTLLLNAEGEKKISGKGRLEECW